MVDKKVTPNKFILPHSAYPNMIEVISAYYGARRDITTKELSELSGKRLEVISGVTTFLTALNILEVTGKKTYSNRPRHLTKLGRELYAAINAEPRSDDKIANCWEKVVRQNDFLGTIYEIIKVQKKISHSQLQSIIIKKAGIETVTSHFSLIGSKVVIDILEKAGMIYRNKTKGKDGIYQVSEVPESADITPDFSSLVSDNRMRNILENRWAEISKCVKNQIPLAATIMMGGLLEGLFLAKISDEPDQSKVYTAKATPRDRVTGASLTLEKWTLHNL